MLNAFTSYIKTKKLFTAEQSVLLAVSGGIDSVVMLDLFYRAGFSFGIAHVNFQLRGEESDGDEQFVKGLAEKYKVKFYSKRFDTKAYAKQYKLSAQMAARELRYRFFEEIKQKHGYTYIATAHHKDDQVETLFINLLRGTGISGLRGILPKQQTLIRPILFAKREEIVNYQLGHKLPYREDSSNASDKYLRNKIRHKLMPTLEEVDENYLERLNANMQRFGESELIYKQHIEQLRKDIISEKSGMFYIAIEKLKILSPLVTYLYEIIKPFGFSFSQAEDIVQSLDHESGKIFNSESYELLKDRSSLIIRTLLPPPTDEVYFIEEKGCTNHPVKLFYDSFRREVDFQIPKEASKAAIDFDKLTFPLKIRRWKKGDSFQPLGSDFEKKISDFFIDKKFSLFEKEEAFLVCSGDDIVWIMGHQLDDRYKITDQTKKVFLLEMLN